MYIALTTKARCKSSVAFLRRFGKKRFIFLTPIFEPDWFVADENEVPVENRINSGKLLRHVATYCSAAESR